MNDYKIRMPPKSGRGRGRRGGRGQGVTVAVPAESPIANDPASSLPRDNKDTGVSILKVSSCGATGNLNTISGRIKA